MIRNNGIYNNHQSFSLKKGANSLNLVHFRGLRNKIRHHFLGRLGVQPRSELRDHPGRRK